MGRQKQLLQYQQMNETQSNFEIESKISPQQIKTFQNGQVACDDDHLLIDLHREYGNQWKKIGQILNDKQHSVIKNQFYSLLRRALRRLNSYIKIKSKREKKRIKPLKLNFIFKLTNLVEFQRTEILKKNHYTRLLYEFLKVRNMQIEKYGKRDINALDNSTQTLTDDQIEKILAQLMQLKHFFVEHNLTKSGKSKKKYPQKFQIKKDIIQKQIQNFCQSNNYSTDSAEVSSNIIKQQMEEKQLNLKFLDICGQQFFSNTSDTFMSYQFDPVLFK